MSNQSIINRYLIKEIILTFIGVSLVLLLIFVSGQLVSLYGKAVSGSIQASSVFKTLGLMSIGNMVFILPLSFYIAILLAFSRLYKDNEMVVLAACGIGPWSILRAVLGLAGLFAIIAGGFSLYLAPWAESQSERIIKQHQQSADVEVLSAGRFRELTKGEGVVYVQEFDEDNLTMNRIFMQYRFEDKNSIISSASGERKTDEKTGDKFLILNNGQRQDGPMENGQTVIIKFAEHGVRLIEKPAREIQYRKRAVSTLELWQRGNNDDIAELQWRISSILFCLILAIMAVPLSKTSPRQGRYSKLALALLIFIIYSNLLNVSRAWLNKDVIPAWIGLWWVHLIALVLALLMFVQWRPVLRRFWLGHR